MNRMRDFWDARAAEDAYYFVDNRLDYGDPDTDAFWSDGEQLLGRISTELGLDGRIMQQRRGPRTARPGVVLAFRILDTLSTTSIAKIEIFNLKDARFSNVL